MTAFSSSYDSKKNGTLKTLNAGSMLPRPTTVNDARLQRVEPHLAEHRRLVALRAAAEHRQRHAAARRLLQSAPICLRLLSQIELSGTTVASLIVCADAARTTPQGTRDDEDAADDAPVCEDCSAGDPGLELLFFLQSRGDDLGFVFVLNFPTHAVARRRRLGQAG